MISFLSTISDLRTEAQSANDFCPQNVICDTISFTRLSWLLYNDELTGYWKRSAKTDTENRKHSRPLISTWPVFIREVEMTQVSADLDAPFVLGSLWGFLQLWQAALQMVLRWEERISGHGPHSIQLLSK